MSEVLCPVLVGRTEQVGELDAALVRAASGHGGVTLISGEAGVGKSRVSRVVTASAEARGWRVGVGRAVAGQGATAFRAVSEAVLSIVRHHPIVAGPELQPFRRALGRVIPGWAVADPGSDGDSLLAACEGVLRLLGAMAGAGVLLVVLEDLHWADAETLAIFEYLSDNLRSERVLCVGTLRTGEPGLGADTLAALRARRAFDVVDLPPLGAMDTGDMARACLSVSELPDGLVEGVLTRADGNPFLIEELLAAAIASGAVIRRGEGWEFIGAARVRLSGSFSETVLRRLNALGPTVREVLEAAAVVGRQIDVGLVGAVTGLDRRVVQQCLRHGVEHQIVTRRDSREPGGEYGFRHALTREAILDEIVPADRARLAAQALGALRAAQPGLAAGASELAARLAVDAGGGPEAARLLLAVGRHALGRGALASATRAVTEARGHVGDDSALTADVDEVLAETLTLAGDRDKAVAAGGRLVRQLTRLGSEPDRLAEAHLRLARSAATATDWPEAATHLATARTLASGAVSARIDALDAHVGMGTGDVDHALVLARRALAFAERSDLPEVACEALEIIGRHARLSDLDHAEAVFGQALAIADRHGLSLSRIRALHELGTIELLDGRPLVWLAQARDEAAAAGALAMSVVIELQIAAGTFQRADRDALPALVTRVTAQAQRYRLGKVIAVALLFEAETQAFWHNRAAMEDALDEAVRLTPGDAEIEGMWWGCRGLYALIIDDLAGAAADLDRGAALMRSCSGIGPDPIRGLWALTSTLEDHDGEAAQAHVRSSGITVNRLNRGFLRYAEAVSSGRRGEHDQAGAIFAEADLVMGCYDWFRHLCRRMVAEAACRDGWGAPAAWLAEAAAYFGDAGQQQLTAGCRARLRSLGMPVSRRGRGVTPVPAAWRTARVTSREMDVLTLVCERLSYKEAAARLYLSHRTVEKHVENLMTKLGVSTRADLLVLAETAGLVPPDYVVRVPK